MRNRGIAIIFAISLLMILGAFLSLLAVNLRGEVVELNRTQLGAQTRQLIIAGARLAPDVIQSGQKERTFGAAELPADLPQPSSLTIRVISGTEVEIEATCGQSSGIEKLRLANRK